MVCHPRQAHPEAADHQQGGRTDLLPSGLPSEHPEDADLLLVSPRHPTHHPVLQIPEDQEAVPRRALHDRDRRPTTDTATFLTPGRRQVKSSGERSCGQRQAGPAGSDPPSTVTTSPVIQAPPGDTRNCTTAATSSGLPIALPSGVRLTISSATSARPMIPDASGVSMMPGATAAGRPAPRARGPPPSSA